MFRHLGNLYVIIQGTKLSILLSRTLPHTQDFTTDDGEVDGDLNPTMPPATDVEVKPVDEDGKPIQGATVTLECGDPSRSYTGKEVNDGTYIFKDAIPQTGQEHCTMSVEAPG